MENLKEPLIPNAVGNNGQMGIGLSSRGIRVAFKNLEYLLPSNVQRGKMATLLHPMSGYFNPGEMTALMGPSGCGKSVTMDVLAGRRTRGTINGSITYAGTRPTEGLLRRITGYVEQFGTLVENLTVFEMLMYTAELKRPMQEGFASKKRAVDELIAKLALEKCRDTKIGNPQLDRGISGGQAKRVNIGIALITNPRVLYMDEPISGLDSFTANEVMSLVKKLVADGITFAATLHSPTPFVFNLFDRLCLLLHGHVVYFGPRQEATSFFEGRAPEDGISADTDAEWLTDVIVKADAAGRAQEYAKFYETSNHHTDVLSHLNAEGEDHPLTEEILEEVTIKTSTVTPSWFAVKTYLKYRTLRNYMDSAFWTTRVSDKIVLTVIMGSIYWGIGSDFDDDKNFTNVSAILVAITGLSSMGASLYIPNLYTDRWLFYREHHDGLYRVITYFMVRMIEELIVVTLLSIVMSTALWFAVGIKGSFLIYFLAFIGNFWCGLSCAFLFTSIAPNLDAAVGGFILYLSTVAMYCGFYIRPADMASYVKWYSKICFMRYSFGAILMNHYESSDESRNVRVLTGGDEGAQSVTPVEYYGLNGRDEAELVGYVYLFALGYAFLAYLAMRYVRFQRH